MGAGDCPPTVAGLAEAVGAELARAGAVVICGGLGGVMEAAARGARSAGGLTVGFLPGARHGDANPFVDIIIVTGFGEGRNVLVARSAHALLALPGEHGTLSEIALALKMGRPVVGLGAWREVAGVVPAETSEEAVRIVLALAERVHGAPSGARR
ncbi:MAG: TIGR00725 family protein [Candidatus Rokubacteria bacterium]|nr:TIGR00725 family protein [Candidatus Rokubacteria bacterium]